MNLNIQNEWAQRPKSRAISSLSHQTTGDCSASLHNHQLEYRLSLNLSSTTYLEARKGFPKVSLMSFVALPNAYNAAKPK
jgi:hypothetical protein